MSRTVKKAVLYSCMLLAVLFMAVAGYVAAMQEKNGEWVSRPVAVYTDVRAAETYILKAYDGRIAVFSSENPGKPVSETDILISSLRAVDQKKLTAGIHAETYEQIVRLLEDFGS